MQVSSCRELRVLALHGLDPANSLEKISPARLFSLSLSHLPVASLGAISFSGAGERSGEESSEKTAVLPAILQQSVQLV